MTYSIIEQCNSTNNFLSVVGGSIKVENAATLPQHLRQMIINNKSGIIIALQRDEMARRNGLLIGITGTLCTRLISRKSAIYLELINDQWEAWRETYESNRQRSINTKAIAMGKTFDYTLNEVKRYMDYIKNYSNPPFIPQ